MDFLYGIVTTPPAKEGERNSVTASEMEGHSCGVKVQGRDNDAAMWSCIAGAIVWVTFTPTIHSFLRAVGWGVVPLVAMTDSVGLQ